MIINSKILGKQGGRKGWKMSLPKIPFRKAKKHLRKKYLITIEKKKDGDLLFLIPDEIVKNLSIKIGDVAIFKVINNKKFTIKFVKNNMYSIVEKIKD